MKIRSEDIDKEVYRTLESLDGMERASTKPFHMTRLESKIQNRLSEVKEERMIRYLVPTFLSLMLMINVFVFSDSMGFAKPNPDESITQLGESYFDVDYIQLDLNYLSNENE